MKASSKLEAFLFHLFVFIEISVSWINTTLQHNVRNERKYNRNSLYTEHCSYWLWYSRHIMSNIII